MPNMSRGFAALKNLAPGLHRLRGVGWGECRSICDYREFLASMLSVRSSHSPLVPDKFADQRKVVASYQRLSRSVQT